jgi:hypothetical protein
MNKQILSILLILTFFASIAQEKIIADTNGKIENGHFICSKFNWKIKIPENYKVTNENDLDKLDQEGKEQINKSTNSNNKFQRREHLIGFEKNSKNTFSASYNVLSESDNSLENHKRTSLNLLKQTYSTVKGARFEYSTSDEKIGEFQFYRIKIEGFRSDNGELVLTQVYYNSFIENNLFGVLISYNDVNEGKMLEDLFIRSFGNRTANTR